MRFAVCAWATGLAMVGSWGCEADSTEVVVPDASVDPDADAGEPMPPAGPDVTVQVTPDGAVEMTVGDRMTFALAASDLVVSQFDLQGGGIGVVEFVRENESSERLSLAASTEQADGVRVEYQDPAGGRTATLEVTVQDADSTLFELTVDGDAPDAIAVPVRCDFGATFHGFGEQYNATDQRGESFPLLVNEQGNGRTGEPGVSIGDEHTTYFPMPYYLDARGFGVLFETNRMVEVDLCESDVEVAWIEVVGGSSVSWRVFHGPAPLDVIRQLGDHLGRPAQPPPWAYGLWIGSQGGRDAVLAEVAALEAADIPVSVLWVQDWGGLRINPDGGSGVQYVWLPDEDFYPDFAGMVSMLHDQGYRFLTYVNPFIVENLGERFSEMQDQELLVKDVEGNTYLTGAVPNFPQRDAFPDLTNPAAQQYVKQALADVVATYDVDGWMADFGEWQPIDGVYFDGRDPIEARNEFPVQWLRASREALSEQRPDGDWVMFGRSGWTGVQGTAQIHWAGDQITNWGELDGLPTVVPALINMGLSGQPYVTHDIAGFQKETPSTKELFMRWTELGAFTPVMRTHEGADKENNWSWETDAETTAHFRKFALVHCALAPELRELGMQAQQDSAPILRHLMLEFPGDATTYQIDDQFMLGSELLVAPVVTEGATSRSVYLPLGTWFNVWTGEELEGGQLVTVDAPIGQPPVFSLGADRTDLREAEMLDPAGCR